jgi:hypothetical protein
MITRKDLESYRLLIKEIDSTKKKIAYYKKKFPYAVHGKVSGSSSQYPFTPRTFTVSGGGYISGGMSEEKLNQKIHDLVYKLSGLLKQYEEKRLEIEEFLLAMENPEAKLLFSYVFVDGMSQEEAGELIGLEQSGVSKKITKYIKFYIPD